MHSLIEIGQVVLERRELLDFLKYYFIKSVLPSLSEDHSPSFEQIGIGCGYMNYKTNKVSEGPAERIEPLGLHIIELIGPNIQKRHLGPT